MIRFLTTGVLLLALGGIARGDEDKSASPADAGVYETDRPGEVENPYALPPGKAELVNYLVTANAAAREDFFGSGGSAVFLDTAVRLGLADRLEGVVAVDSFLAAHGPSGGPGAAGLGYATLAAKWNFLKDGAGDFGIALAPFVRLPLARTVGGTSRAASGLIVPFDCDLEGGWELEGSSGFSRTPGDPGEWNTEWENQVSLQRTLGAGATAYLELQLQSGDGPPAWATEFGVGWRLSPSWLIDLGGSLGLGRSSRGRMGYAGAGWSF